MGSSVTEYKQLKYWSVPLRLFISLYVSNTVVKVKVTAWHLCKRRCSPIPFVTQHWKVGGLHDAPAALLLPSGRYPVPIVQEAGWALGPRNLTLPGFDPQTVYPIASRHDDNAVRPAAQKCNTVYLMFVSLAACCATIVPSSGEHAKYIRLHCSKLTLLNTVKCSR
jgi:hypothetical protein